MQLPAGELFLECLVHPLLALDTVFANKFGADHQGLEMLAVAVKREMIAGHAREDEFFDLIGMHLGQALSFQPRFRRLSVTSDTARKQEMTTTRLVSGATSETPKKP